MSIDIYKEHEDNLTLAFGILCASFSAIHLFGRASGFYVGDLNATSPLISLSYLVSTFGAYLFLHSIKKMGRKTKSLLSIARWLCVMALVFSCFFTIGALPVMTGDSFLNYNALEMLAYILHSMTEFIISTLGFSLVIYSSLMVAKRVV